MDADVIIVGAGMAGLTCAKTLFNQGLKVLVLEASDAVGGRLRTDEVDGFLLDRGTIVFPTQFETAQQILDYEALDLHFFDKSAWSHVNGSFQRMSDPFLHKEDLLFTMLADLGSLGDKLNLLKANDALAKLPIEAIFEGTETPARAVLKERWLISDTMIDRYVRPFLATFLGPDLEGSGRMFEFMYRAFSKGFLALPAKGVQAIPQQLVTALPETSILLNQKVAQVGEGWVTTTHQQRFKAPHIVLATDAYTAQAWLPTTISPPDFLKVHTFYFAAEEAPLTRKVWLMEGEAKGPINHACIPSNVCPSYAPAGEALIAVNVLLSPSKPKGAILERTQLESKVRTHLHQWFGNQVHTWRFLRSYYIPQSVPDHRASIPYRSTGFYQVHKGLTACGDYCVHGTVEGAMISGLKTAEYVISQL